MCSGVEGSSVSLSFSPLTRGLGVTGWTAHRHDPPTENNTLGRHAEEHEHANSGRQGPTDYGCIVFCGVQEGQFLKCIISGGRQGELMHEHDELYQNGR